jgi:hypothetical protein
MIRILRRKFAVDVYVAMLLRCVYSVFSPTPLFHSFFLVSLFLPLFLPTLPRFLPILKLLKYSARILSMIWHVCHFCECIVFHITKETVRNKVLWRENVLMQTISY